MPFSCQVHVRTHKYMHMCKHACMHRRPCMLAFPRGMPDCPQFALHELAGGDNDLSTSMYISASMCAHKHICVRARARPGGGTLNRCASVPGTRPSSHWQAAQSGRCGQGNKASEQASERAVQTQAAANGHGTRTNSYRRGRPHRRLLVCAPRRNLINFLHCP